MKYLTVITILCLSFTAFADSDDDFYNKLLDEHLKHGHLDRKELTLQKQQMIKNKQWQSQFHEQVRGVASTMQTPKRIIELNNPVIEIPIK